MKRSNCSVLSHACRNVGNILVPWAYLIYKSVLKCILVPIQFVVVVKVLFLFEISSSSSCVVSCFSFSFGLSAALIFVSVPGSEFKGQHMLGVYFNGFMSEHSFILSKSSRRHQPWSPPCFYFVSFYLLTVWHMTAYGMGGGACLNPSPA